MPTSSSAAPDTRLIELGKPPQMDGRCHPSPGPEEEAGSNMSARSDSLGSSSCVFSSDASHQPVTGDDCAELVLACLHCRFHEFLLLLQDTTWRLVTRCWPALDYVAQSGQRDHRGFEGCNCDLGLDWDFCNSCQDSAELLELAMEISEVCYR
nr:myoD family inhibitor domain-containing protein 2-like [Nerophis lumbriciformis]